MERLRDAANRLAEQLPAERAANLLDTIAGILEVVGQLRSDIAELRVAQAKIAGDVQVIIHQEVRIVAAAFEARVRAAELRPRRRRRESEREDHGDDFDEGHP